MSIESKISGIGIDSNDLRKSEEIGKRADEMYNRITGPYVLDERNFLTRFIYKYIL